MFIKNGLKDYTIIYIVLFLLLPACAYSPQARYDHGFEIAKNHGWRPLIIATSNFDLSSFLPQPKQSDDLTIYIEGDGLSWLDASTPSSDPTPVNPIGLEMAVEDKYNTAVYPARPCQYQNTSRDKNCADSRWWTSHRFAPEVIKATDEAVEILKQKFAAKRITLVGYSGGGALAALVAARRHDIKQLVTIAGNLDIQAWTELHKLAPLSGSLNPADYAAELTHIPQVHFVGSNDKIMPVSIAESYARKFPTGHKPQIRIIANYDHACCWSSGGIEWNN